MVRLMGKAPRLALVGFAAGFAVMGRAFWLGRGEESFLPTFWPLAFLAVAVGCAALAILPGRRAAIVVGSAAFTACLSRVAGVAVNIADGAYATTVNRNGALLAVYPMLAGAVLYAFHHGIAPWAAVEELRRRRHRRP